MSSILCCFSKIFCCCGPKSKVDPALEDTKPSCSMVYTDPSNIPRVIPPEGFSHYYPYGTVFPGEDKTPPKESSDEELTEADHVTVIITKNGAVGGDVEAISAEESLKAGSTGK